MWPQTFLGFIPRRKRKIKGFKQGGVVCPTLLECSQPMSMSDCWEICLSYQVLRETGETLFQWKSEFNRSECLLGLPQSQLHGLVLWPVNFSQQSPANDLCFRFSLSLSKGQTQFCFLISLLSGLSFPSSLQAPNPISLWIECLIDDSLVEIEISLLYGTSSVSDFHSKIQDPGPSVVVFYPLGHTVSSVLYSSCLSPLQKLSFTDRSASLAGPTSDVKRPDISRGKTVCALSERLPSECV